jgi:large subunit ribosomal protein L20
MRVTNAPASRKRRIRTIKAAKGFRLRRSKLYRYAADALDHGRQYAFRDRKAKKRTFRSLWTVRINAAARAAGITYSRLMEGLKAANIDMDRKVLADIAALDAPAFAELVTAAQNALKAKTDSKPKVAVVQKKAAIKKAKAQAESAAKAKA